MVKKFIKEMQISILFNFFKKILHIILKPIKMFRDELNGVRIFELETNETVEYFKPKKTPHSITSIFLQQKWMKNKEILKIVHPSTDMSEKNSH